MDRSNQTLVHFRLFVKISVLSGEILISFWTPGKLNDEVLSVEELSGGVLDEEELNEEKLSGEELCGEEQLEWLDLNRSWSCSSKEFCGSSHRTTIPSLFLHIQRPVSTWSSQTCGWLFCFRCCSHQFWLRWTLVWLFSSLELFFAVLRRSFRFRQHE